MGGCKRIWEDEANKLAGEPHSTDQQLEDAREQTQEKIMEIVSEPEFQQQRKQQRRAYKKLLRF